MAFSDNYVNQSDAAKLLGVDRSTLWRWLKKGRIQPQGTVNGMPIFDRSYLQLYAATLKKRRVAA